MRRMVASISRFANAQVLDAIAGGETANQRGRGDRAAVELEGGAQTVLLDQVGPVHGERGIGLGQVHDDLPPSAKAIQQVGQPAVKEQPSVVDDQDPVAEPFDILEVVRREDDGRAVFAVDVADELADALFGDHVQADGRLVEKQQRGLMEHGRAEVGAHPLAQ